MKKSTIFTWFFPFAALIFYLIIFFKWIKPGMSPDLFIIESFIKSIQDFLDGLSHGIGDYLTNLGVHEIIIGIISSIMMGSLVFVLPICALCCVGSTVGFATRHMGDSDYEEDAGYYTVTWDDDTLSVDRETHFHLTGAGWLRLLMFFTYLFWFIPVFIVQCKKAKQFAARQS